MQIRRTSMSTGVVHAREIDCTQEQLNLYYSFGANLQDAFPNLSPGDREFIKTGITPEEWDEMFSPFEDEEQGE